ncbi:hypothetical protein GCM10010172_63740 [Paractinoplanes ferrugineus]
MLPALAFCAALAALAGCDRSDGTPSHAPSARAGFGDPTAPAVRDVDEAMFRTPSKNIYCALTRSAVRCDIGEKKWTLPAKAADCDFDWGNGLYLDHGAAGLTCAGDTLLNSSTETLEYGTAIRSGTVRCTSESTGLRCEDEKTTRGFTMAVARYSLF